MIVLKTVDAHVGGTPLRLVVDGFPSPHGRTMADKLRWANRHAAAICQLLMREPRGHAHMVGAVLTESATPACEAGVLFMDGAGFRPLSGHGAMAAAALAVTRGLLMRSDPAGPAMIDTAVGPFSATVAASVAGEMRAEVLGCPSFVVQGGVDVALPARSMRVDIAFSGGFYALVDSESAGVPLSLSFEIELRRVAATIVDRVGQAFELTHPLWPYVSGLSGVVFTGPAQTSGADLRVVSVTSGGRVSRGPSGSGLAAVTAVLSAMGLPPEGAGIVVDGLIGTTLHGCIVRHTTVGEFPAVVTRLAGSVWLTGEHTFNADVTDPLGEGFKA